MRLTNNLKDAIVLAAIKQSGILKERNELRRLLQNLAEDIRVEQLGGKSAVAAIESAKKEIGKIAEKIPKASLIGFNHDAYASVSFAGKRMNLSYTDDREERVRYKGTAMYSADHEFSLRFDEAVKIENKINDKELNVKSAVLSTLNSVKTVKQLLEAWPEAKELLPESQKPKPTLPAIRRDDLNKIIGLPSVKEAA